jgi:hypothetical protein
MYLLAGILLSGCMDNPFEPLYGQVSLGMPKKDVHVILGEPPTEVYSGAGVALDSSYPSSSLKLGHPREHIGRYYPVHSVVGDVVPNPLLIALLEVYSRRNSYFQPCWLFVYYDNMDRLVYLEYFCFE